MRLARDVERRKLLKGGRQSHYYFFYSYFYSYYSHPPSYTSIRVLRFVREEKEMYTQRCVRMERYVESWKL